MGYVDIKVFEQYEYHDYLITIQDHFGGPVLEGHAVPTRYAHLFNDIIDVMYNVDYIFEGLGIKEDDYPIVYSFDPDDTLVRLQNVKTDSPASVLSFIINELNWLLDIDKPKMVVLKQIYKKSITPKSSKNNRGFNQVAWASMVKLRDGKCTECSSVYDLHAHHIKSYKDNESLRYDVNNGITLCGACHREWHKKNGR